MSTISTGESQNSILLNEELDFLAISGVNLLNFSLKLTFWSLFFLFGFVAFLNHYYSLGIFILGLGIAHGVELSHQVLHGTAVKSHFLSRVIGIFLCSPMLISYSAYKNDHLIHHQKIGTKEDSEFFSFNLSATFWQKITNFFLITHYFSFIGIFFRSLLGRYKKPNANETVSKNISLDISIAGLLLIASWFVPIGDTGFNLFTVWILSLTLVAGPIHTLVELPEHFGCEKLNKDLLYNTRSIDTNKIMVWYTNGNNYHIEHHMMPLVLPEHAHLLHKDIAKKSPYVNSGYIDFLINGVWRREK